MIYIVRHGQTDWNYENKLLSLTDIPLNHVGVEQCRDAEKLVKNLNYDIVFCSPLLRTRQTMEIVNSKKKEEKIDKRLIERDARSLEGIDVSNIDYKAFWTVGKDDIFDSEKIEELRNRVYEFLDEIKNKYKDKNILIVTHNGVCRIISTYFKGIPKNGDLSKSGQNNAEIRIYELK